MAACWLLLLGNGAALGDEDQGPGPVDIGNSPTWPPLAGAF
jgi:hypothetical protein